MAARKFEEAWCSFNCCWGNPSKKQRDFTPSPNQKITIIHSFCGKGFIQDPKFFVPHTNHYRLVLPLSTMVMRLMWEPSVLIAICQRNGWIKWSAKLRRQANSMAGHGFNQNAWKIWGQAQEACIKSLAEDESQWFRRMPQLPFMGGHGLACAISCCATRTGRGGRRISRFKTRF